MLHYNHLKLSMELLNFKILLFPMFFQTLCASNVLPFRNMQGKLKKTSQSRMTDPTIDQLT